MKYSRDDIYYWTIIAMLILVSYWVYIVVAPTFEIVSKTNILLNKMDNVLEQGVTQNEKIINNQDNNSAQVEQLINQTNENQQEAVLYLVGILNQSNTIGNHTADLILDSIDITNELQQNLSKQRAQQSEEILDYFTVFLNRIEDKVDRMQNTTSDTSGKISGFLGGPVVTNETVAAIINDITIAQAQNRTQ